jgi:hypothetical protein
MPQFVTTEKTITLMFGHECKLTYMDDKLIMIQFRVLVGNREDSKWEEVSWLSMDDKKTLEQFIEKINEVVNNSLHRTIKEEE